MVKEGQLVATRLSAAGGWLVNSKLLHWFPIKKDTPYFLIEIKDTTWTVNKIGIILTPCGILLEVLLDIFNPIEDLELIPL